MLLLLNLNDEPKNSWKYLQKQFSYHNYFLILQPFDRWETVGTEGYISPGILSKEDYVTADVWGLIVTLYELVEDKLIFKSDEETLITGKDFELEGKNGSRSFKNFIRNMLNSIFDGNFTHEKLVKSSWMRR